MTHDMKLDLLNRLKAAADALRQSVLQAESDAMEEAVILLEGLTVR